MRKARAKLFPGMSGSTPHPNEVDAAANISSRLPRGSRLASLVTRLAIVNGIAALAGIVTGPILAHALGAAGRGTLAAILVPVTLAPWILGFGLGGYLSRAAARGTSPGVLLGTLGTIGLGIGVLGAVAGIPVALFLADGRSVVLVMLMAGFCLLPLSLVQQLAGELALGLGEFRAVILSRLTAPAVALAAMPTLFAFDGLTVTSASIVVFGGGLMAGIPLVPVVARAAAFHFRWATARAALGFGARTWLGTIGSIVNTRLDQLVMIKLVSESELGLYAVAVTFASFLVIASSALPAALLPRVARGDFALAVRSMRVTVMLLAGPSLLLGFSAPILLPVLFGTEFQDATFMAWILLGAELPFLGALILGSALINIGRPGAASAGQLVGVVVTAVGLPLLLPSMGGEGAALVSLSAYLAQFAALVALAQRSQGGRIREFLVPTRSDIEWLRALLRKTAQHLRQRRERDRARSASAGFDDNRDGSSR